MLAGQIHEKFGLNATVSAGSLQIEHEHGAEFIAKLAASFAGKIQAITFRKPTLEDVFIRETGHKFWEEEENHE